MFGRDVRARYLKELLGPHRSEPICPAKQFVDWHRWCVRPELSDRTASGDDNHLMYFSVGGP
jgi:hypothetical protein